MMSPVRTSTRRKPPSSLSLVLAALIGAPLSVSRNSTVTVGTSTANVPPALTGAHGQLGPATGGYVHAPATGTSDVQTLPSDAHETVWHMNVVPAATQRCVGAHGLGKHGSL